VALTLIEAAVRSSAPASKSAPPEYNFASFFRDPDAPIDDEEDDEEASNDSEGVHFSFFPGITHGSAWS